MKILNIGLAIAALTAINLGNNDLTSVINLKEEKLIITPLYQEKPILSFSSSVRFGIQENQLSVLISTDFSGEYTEEAIKKANWKKAAESISLATGDAIQASGDIDLSSIVKNKKTYYIAFKYTGAAPTAGKPTQRTWTVNNVKLGDQNLKSFNIVNSAENDEKTGWAKASEGVVFRPASTLKKSEGWAIIKVTNS